MTPRRGLRSAGIVALAAGALTITLVLSPSAQTAPDNPPRQFRALVDAGNIGEYMRRMSARPHHLGSA